MQRAFQNSQDEPMENIEEIEQNSCVAEGSVFSLNQQEWNAFKESALSVDSKSAVALNSFLNLEEQNDAPPLPSVALISNEIVEAIEQ